MAVLAQYGRLLGNDAAGVLKEDIIAFAEL